MIESMGIRGTPLEVIDAGRLGEEHPMPARSMLWCDSGHPTGFVLGDSATVPELWLCRCGLPAGQDRADHSGADQAETVIGEPLKTHFDHVRDRRTEAEGRALLAEALHRLQARRLHRRGLSRRHLTGLPQA